MHISFTRRYHGFWYFVIINLYQVITVESFVQTFVVRTQLCPNHLCNVFYHLYAIKNIQNLFFCDKNIDKKIDMSWHNCKLTEHS